MPDTYEPQEDSFLLAEQVKKYARGIVLDIGTGSGIQAITAAKNPRVKKVYASDVNPEAVKYAKGNALRQGVKNIIFMESDIFQNIPTIRFDTIIFNPPYLPADVKVPDRALDGGKKGYEVLGKFIEQVSDHLSPDGIVLFIFSSLTNKQKIDEFLVEHLFSFEEIAQEPLFMEQLFVYMLKKSPALLDLEKKKVKEISAFDHGKRGLIFTGKWKKKKIAMKIKNPSSTALNRIENEAYWLKRLNKKEIGPTLFFSTENVIGFEFIEGLFIDDFIEYATRKKIMNVIHSLFFQLKILDDVGVDKEEMHHPLKHIIIGKAPILIDFERCHVSQSPKNVTQFCQFLSGKIRLELAKKGITYRTDEMRNAGKQYKKTGKIESIFSILNHGNISHP